MNEEVVLYNWQYVFEPGGCRKLAGNVKNHPNFLDGHKVFVSKPIKFYPESRKMITYSGRTYILKNCVGNEELNFKFIKEDTNGQ